MIEELVFPDDEKQMLCVMNLVHFIVLGISHKDIELYVGRFLASCLEMNVLSWALYQQKEEPKRGD